MSLETEKVNGKGNTIPNLHFLSKFRLFFDFSKNSKLKYLHDF